MPHRSPYPFPYYVNKGTFASGAGALTVTAPANVQADDLLILVLESENSPITLGTNSGRWTEFTNSPQSTGTANAAGGVRVGVYYRWSPNTAPGSQATVDTGGHHTGIMIAIRGVSNTAGFFVSAGYARAASANVATPEVTTPAPYYLIVNCIGLDKDLADSDTITAWFPDASIANTKEIHDQTVTTGAGGGIAIFLGEKQTAGATGNNFGTGDTSTTRAYLTIGLKPGHNRRMRVLR